MFEHSIKVPRLYKTAARIVEKVKKDGTSVKQLVYEKKHPNLKALYALVVETLRNEESLKNILKKTQILEKENRLDQFLARVLITELLWGKKKLSGESKPIKTILSYQDQFLDNYTDKKTKSKKQKINKPKYVRVNTLKISIEEVINTFRNEGWSLIRCGDGSDYSAFLATSASLSEDQFMVDTLIKDLLIFPPKTEFYEHRLYKNGSIVLQDKASCLSPFLLAPPSGATVLDMCAAPGMKCMQIASMVGENGKVYAIERDPRRYDILKSLLEGTDSKNVTAINNDVLKLTDFDVPDVEYILVDPSCSGSGIIDRIDFEDNPQIDGPRLKKLAGFQIKILRHALENFKNVKKIVYSTCSIYPDENEIIVQEAIEKTPNFKLVPLNEVLKNKWYNFGSKNYKIGSHCLYAKPEIDKTNGFFIAVFEKLENGETNEFYIEKKTFQNHSNDKEQNQEMKIKTEKIELTSQNQEELNYSDYSKLKKKKKFGNAETEPNFEIKNSYESNNNGKKKNKHKNKNSEGNDFEENNLNSKNETIETKKRKKSKIEPEDATASICENKTVKQEHHKKHKKKCKKSKKEHDELEFDNQNFDSEPKSKKKRKITNEYNITNNFNEVYTNFDTNKFKSLDQNNFIPETNDLGSTKKKKRKKNLENYETEVTIQINNNKNGIEFENQTINKTKKKQKKKERELRNDHQIDVTENDDNSNKNNLTETELKSKKKRKKEIDNQQELANIEPCSSIENESNLKKKKKKSKKSDEMVDNNVDENVSEKHKKCKKSHKNKENIDEIDERSEKKTKKKKSKKIQDENTIEIFS